MSKAEDLSKQYREFREKCGIKDPVMLNEIEEAYFEGYNQAEKDLKLTWDDILLIHRCIKDSMNYNLYKMQSVDGQQEVYQNALDRFYKLKEEKQYGKG